MQYGLLSQINDYRFGVPHRVKDKTPAGGLAFLQLNLQTV